MSLEGPWTGRQGRVYRAVGQAAVGSAQAVVPCVAEGPPVGRSVVGAGHRVALRLLVLDDPTALRSFRRAAREHVAACQRGQVPTCVPVLDRVGTEALPGLVLGWTPHNLESWWREAGKTPNALPDLFTVMADIARQVGKYHQIRPADEPGATIILPVIRPDALLCDAEGRWLIGRFGAVVVQDATREPAQGAVDSFRAPEDVFGVAPAEPAARDTWSLCASLFSLLRMRPLIASGEALPVSGSASHQFRLHRVNLVSDLYARKPRLFRGRGLDAREFLYPEALPGSDRESLAESLKGSVGDPGREAALFESLAAMLDRGLAIDPAARFREPLELATALSDLARQFRGARAEVMSAAVAQVESGGGHTGAFAAPLGEPARPVRAEDLDLLAGRLEGRLATSGARLDLLANRLDGLASRMDASPDHASAIEGVRSELSAIAASVHGNAAALTALSARVPAAPPKIPPDLSSELAALDAQVTALAQTVRAKPAVSDSVVQALIARVQAAEDAAQAASAAASAAAVASASASASAAEAATKAGAETAESSNAQQDVERAAAALTADTAALDALTARVTAVEKRAKAAAPRPTAVGNPQLGDRIDDLEAWVGAVEARKPVVPWWVFAAIGALVLGQVAAVVWGAMQHRGLPASTAVMVAAPDPDPAVVPSAALAPAPPPELDPSVEDVTPDPVPSPDPDSELEPTVEPPTAAAPAPTPEATEPSRRSSSRSSPPSRQAPTPAPEPAPVAGDTDADTTPAMFRVDGGTGWIAGSDGVRRSPGSVPPGRYDVHALPSGGSDQPLGAHSVPPGGTLTIRCGFGTCRVAP